MHLSSCKIYDIALKKVKSSERTNSAINEEEWNVMKKSVDGCLKILQSVNSPGEPTQVTSSPVVFSRVTSLEQACQVNESDFQSGGNESESSISREIRRGAGTAAKPLVMIIYSTDNSEIVKKMKYKLEMGGVPIWFDEQSLHPGPLLDTLSEAIDKSNSVLVCFSQAFQRSPWCRMESNYAFKQGKPFIFVRVQENFNPDGWLSFLMGNDIYFDITGGLFENNSTRLVQHVRKVLGLPDQEQHAQKYNGKSKSGSVAEGNEQNSAGTGFPKWTEEEVLKWLGDHGMQFLSLKYALYIKSFL